MAMTLVEAAKLETGNDVRRAVIEVFAASSDIMQRMPFEGISGNAQKFNREHTLPSVGFRAVNEAYSEGSGKLDPRQEALAIAGGDLDVDNFIIQTEGESARAAHVAMKVKALSLNLTLKVIKGDQASDPREFNGMQVRCDEAAWSATQRIDAGATSGGDALSLTKLDELIDAVEDANALIMNKTMRRRLTQAARNTSVGGDIRWEPGEFGRRIAFYNDLPILIADKDNTNTQMLPFTEANPGGGAAASTSIYCVSFGETGFHGIQNGEMDVRDLGEIDDKPVQRVRVEWYVSASLKSPYALARLRGIKDAAVTA